MKWLSAAQGQAREPFSCCNEKPSCSKLILNWWRNVSALLYTIIGKINQKLIIRMTHKKDPTRKAIGVIFFIAYKISEARANTFTKIIMIRISGRLIKWYRNACNTWPFSYSKYIVIYLLLVLLRSAAMTVANWFLAGKRTTNFKRSYSLPFFFLIKIPASFTV